ncbi:hypothetical protein ACE6H2_027547 [Prunus campanulata]
MARSSSNGDSDDTIRSRSKRAREDERYFNFDDLIGAEEEEEEEEPNNEPQVHEQQEGSHVVVITDPELFDCPICYEPLTIPVYQCDQNGHIACSSCRTKINNKCPSCSRFIGFNRCRAIEKALESITTSCQNLQYGCKKSLTFDKKGPHQKACVYSPCSCPLLYCNFVSSAKQVYRHFTSSHEISAATLFKFNNSFPVLLNAGSNFRVLQEKNDGTLFILKNHYVEGLGNVVTISCIQPVFMSGFFYELATKAKKDSLRLQSFTRSTPSRQVIDDGPPKTGLLLIPCDFITSDGQLKMDICIWPKLSNILRN